MRRRRTSYLLTVLLLLGSRALLAQTVTTIRDSGDPARRVDIVILGDGYTSGEMAQFASDVTQFLAGVLAQEPFHEYQNYLNVRRIDVASTESGADHPERNPQVFKNTAFDATYNCANIQRLICVSFSKVMNAAAVLPPSQRDLVVVIVNDPEYGGSGGSIAVASTNVSAVELILHETGHTFAFLADEYTSQPPACSDTVEPANANSTKETNRNLIKWAAWIDAQTPVPTTSSTQGVPGLYQGSQYCPTTLYRPTYNSKMRSLGPSYDQINTEKFVKRFYEFARPIETKSPASSTLTIPQGQSTQFSIATPAPLTHALTVIWQLDGQQVATGPTYTLSTGGLSLGNHTVVATVSDPTPMVRIDPQPLLVEQANWTVSVGAGAKRVRGQITSQ